MYLLALFEKKRFSSLAKLRVDFFFRKGPGTHGGNWFTTDEPRLWNLITDKVTPDQPG